MSQDHISNVLAERYASPAMRAIWSGEGEVRLERDYWIAVLRGQRDLGIPVPDGVIESYERVKDQINLASIMQRESASPATTSRRASRSSAIWPAMSTCTRA
ncbi:hypothetical protein [Bradyrhizobium sp. USDA 4452]